MPKKILHYCICLSLCLSMACVAQTPQNKASSTKPTAATTTTKRLWNLQDADIHAVIAAIAKETQKNFLVDPRVQGKITIVSDKPINAKAAYQLFLSALQILGYAAVPSGNVIKIVPDLNARSLPAPLATDKNPGVGDELVARVIPVHYVSALQLVPILRPLMPEWSNIAAYAPSNVIIVAGRAGNIEHIKQIISQVDRANNNDVEVITLHHASASKLVNALKQLQDSNRASGRVSNISFAADEEGNKILMSGSPAERLHMRVLISQLDTAGAIAGNTRVIHLKYLDAKKLAPVLAGIAHSAYIADDNDGKKSAPQMPIPSASDSNSQVAIKADETTNSVVISAPTNTMRTLLRVITELDIRPTQVLVQAVIAQVDESMVNQLGITWGTNEDSAGDTTDNGTDNSLGFQQGVGIIKKGNLRILISALTNSTSADVLSTPSISVLDNQKAEISVGKNVGMVNRSYAVSANDNSTSPFNTIERKNVALDLAVTPHITPNRRIQLQIQQKDDTLENPSNPGDNPVINTSLIKTTVMVKDGDILVLGGLISHDLTNGHTKIPILGDLPLVGNLFHYKNQNLEKKNLMIFIRPVLLLPGNRTKQITWQKYNEIRELQLLKSRGIGLITNVNEPPVLQPLTKPIPNLPAPFANMR